MLSGLVRLAIGFFVWCAALPLMLMYAAYLAWERDPHSAMSWFTKTSRWFFTGKSNY